LLAQSVPSHVRVICSVNGSSHDIQARLGPIPCPANLEFIPCKAEGVYPANRLRNRALAGATADWVFYIDCDFVFGAEFWTHIYDKAEQLTKSNDRVCCVPSH